MRKVMIVDDESLVRVGFQTIIDWEGHGYQISGIYKNGLQAWEAIQREGPPDVLLTDIKMPEMDGLELIRQIRKKNIDVHILILSSHDEFNYLRASINLRVQDYILEHTFEPDELIQTLNNLTYSNSVASSKQESTIDWEKQKFLENSRNISRVLTSGTEITSDQYPNMIRMWGLNNTQGHWISIRTYPRENPYLDSEIKALSFLLQEIMGRFRSIVFLGMDKETFHVLFILDDEFTSLSEKVFEEWATTVLQKLDISIVIGISAKESFSKEIVKMRKQAEIAINKSFYCGQGIYYCNKENSKETLSIFEWASLKEKVLELLNENELKFIINWMYEVKEEFANRYISDEEAIRFLEIVYKSFLESRMETHIVHKGNIEKVLQSYLISYKDSISKSVPVWDEFLQITLKMMEEQEQTFLKKAKSPWIQEIIQFIKEHYTEPIRLEDAAHLANFNENYFSRLFREETGVTFLEYVTKLRIEQAINLLKNSNLSTEEISFQIGYPNSNYFVKVFKKVTGMTISEYRSNPSSLDYRNIWNR